MSAARGERRAYEGAVVTEDFRRRILSRGNDARGDFAILECQHKSRRITAAPSETERWCQSCANRSPFR